MSTPSPLDRTWTNLASSITRRIIELRSGASMQVAPELVVFRSTSTTRVLVERWRHITAGRGKNCGTVSRQDSGVPSRPRNATGISTMRASGNSAPLGHATSARGRSHQTPDTPPPTPDPVWRAGFIEPMLLSRTNSLPEGKNWLYELKLDGYRAIAFKSRARPSFVPAMTITSAQDTHDFSGAGE